MDVTVARQVLPGRDERRGRAIDRAAPAQKTGPLAVLLAHHLLLWLGLFGVAICLLLNQATETFMAILQAGIIVHFVADRRLTREVDRVLLLPLCIFLLPLSLNLLAPDELTNNHYASGLVWSTLLITSLWIVGGRPLTQARPWLLPVIIAVLIVFFIAQTGAFLVAKDHDAIIGLLQGHGAEGYAQALRRYLLKNTFAMFPNIHVYALFAVISLPVSVFCIWQCRRPLSKVFLSLGAFSGMYLLLVSGSRPGWLALLAAGLVVTPLMRKKIRPLLGGVLAAVPLVLYAADIHGFKTRINDLIFNLAGEERMSIWSEAWEMQKASDWQGWLLGHGLGSFGHYFQSTTHISKEAAFVFPHNFLLEILFNSGILSLLAVIVGYVLFYQALLAIWKNTTAPGHQDLAVLLISVMTAHLVHSFLTLPFLTGRAILSLAFIVGVAIWLLRQEKQHASELSPAYDHNSQL